MAVIEKTGFSNYVGEAIDATLLEISDFLGQENYSEAKTTMIGFCETLKDLDEYNDKIPNHGLMMYYKDSLDKFINNVYSIIKVRKEKVGMEEIIVDNGEAATGKDYELASRNINRFWNRMKLLKENIHEVQANPTYKLYKEMAETAHKKYIEKVEMFNENLPIIEKEIKKRFGEKRVEEGVKFLVEKSCEKISVYGNLYWESIFQLQDYVNNILSNMLFNGYKESGVTSNKVIVNNKNLERFIKREKNNSE